QHDRTQAAEALPAEAGSPSQPDGGSGERRAAAEGRGPAACTPQAATSEPEGQPVTLVLTALLALAAYRLWRLVALDYITESLRFRFLPEGTVRSTFVTCPWCLGTWLVLALWLVTWLSIDTMRVPGLVLGSAATLVGLLG